VQPVQGVGRVISDRHQRHAEDAQGSAEPRQHDHRGDHRGRRQHDADLQCGGGDFVVMIFGEGDVALLLSFAGFFLQLLAAFVFLGIRLVTIRRLLPGRDPFLHGRLDLRVARGRHVQLQGFGCRAQRRLADVLGLIERPQIRGLDVGAQALGLRALAQGLGERQEQREHRDQERDLLVRAGDVLGLLGVLDLFVCGHGHPSPEKCIRARV
jgi:hypothetical protein